MRRRALGLGFAAALLGVILGLVLAPTGAAQSGDDLRALGKEVEALKAGQAAIQKDLLEIKSLLRMPQLAPPAAPQAVRAPTSAEAVDRVLDVEGAPFKGEKGAKVAVVEFTDYPCPFCSRYFRQT